MADTAEQDTTTEVVEDRAQPVTGGLRVEDNVTITQEPPRSLAEEFRHAGFPGEIATHLHDHEKATLPDWYRGGERAADAGKLTAAVLRAVERDRRAVSYPPAVGCWA